MEYNNNNLLQEIDRALKFMKEAETCFEHVEEEDYLKTKLAKLRYDFARQEYIRLLKIAKERKMRYNLQDLYEKILDV
ncbi:hypothetical protein ACETAC_02755 [Aceticella autotrophica]|jgi:hypothetical protein|uniref:DUF2508 domain-containing protein n=1 Tax=Aceticella autotrophica TaxID=2755338 RepID=A0A975AWN1_9THEO|nr:hypothetical protein [Aceticella autotrophica]MDI6603858.1 hypothetical protein [Thermoanaerobacteraceae bacterium]QSZ27827.1 hypothetical protein ACETAC_02755 [Aceticella autotrophica]